MYNLRKITKDKIETNQALGENYTLVYRDKNKEDFNKLVEAYFKKGISEDVYCFVSSKLGQIFGLEEDSEAYIMTDSGSTFSNLTHRK
ncbi:MAG: hypothetical protein GY928_01975 [Colwellia sp.]|nr:hypothetical protein [Colwellia sp.]